MKHIPLLLAGILLTGIATTPVMADYGGAGPGKEGDMKPYAKMEKHMGKHEMTGTVEKIDQAKGMVELKTDAGTLNLHFPPPSIKDLKVGDTISVFLSYTKGKEIMKKEMMKEKEMK